MVGDDRKRVFLGMPGYGDVAAGAARAFYRATAGGLCVRLAYRQGSLLAQNCNRLWCDVLNEGRLGRPPAYFAMLHSDVQAEDFWLDALVEELEAQGLDALGVAVPIKDRRGLTSAAVGRPDGDPWRCLCRLSLAEVRRLPETFTAEDVGGPLLLNTGCFVCRFDMAWAPGVCFTINDRIGTNEAGEYVAEVESEDWGLSRQLRAAGLRLGCTRKVRVGHTGPMTFFNDHVWGECDRDDEATGPRAAPAPVPADWRAAAHVETGVPA